MAKVGEQLKQSESGWKRYDDNDENILYSPMIMGLMTTSCYNGTYHSQDISDNKTSAKFNFQGTKIRIISYSDLSEDGIYTIVIDGKSENFSTVYGTNTYQVIVYEKIGLSDKEHYVEIKGEIGKRFVLDAIDIDSSGVLKPYEVIYNNKYLIEQNDKYYSIKSKFYDIDKYNPLLIENPTKEDFIDNGFEDVSELFITKNNAIVNGIKSELGNGNMFSFDIKDDFKSILNIE